MRGARGWILGTGPVLSRVFPRRQKLGCDLARGTLPAYLQQERDTQLPLKRQTEAAHHPPEGDVTRVIRARIGLTQETRVDGGGGPWMWRGGVRKESPRTIW